LGQGKTIKDLAALAKSATPRLFRALARYPLPQPLLARALSAADPCTRINGVLGAKHLIIKDPQGALDLAREDSNPYVRFNIIFLSPFSGKLASLADRLHSNGSGISTYQWQLLLGKWPPKAASTYGRKWNCKPLRLPAAPWRSAVRFQFHQVPANLACVVVASPSGGFRSVTPHESGNLALLGVPRGKVSLHPILTSR
ncbi:hypothetical protein KJ865_11730, partial [Myxococcota bacterium]|nr:hypothetical protein [Myxococcota bacterium]